MAKLPAREVFVYGVACIERRALELADSMELALVSAEALSGGHSLRKYLRCEIGQMQGESPRPVASAAEQAAIAEVEREIAREYPFYFDDARLSELHERYGRLRLQ
ncbi:MAG TPA: hypothetical protein VF278_21220 [Pirellulales bacterium]